MIKVAAPKKALGPQRVRVKEWGQRARSLSIKTTRKSKLKGRWGLQDCYEVNCTKLLVDIKDRYHPPNHIHK